MTTTKIWNDLPRWEKGVIVLLFIVIAIIIAVALIRFTKRFLEKQAAQKTIDLSADELKTALKTETPSYPDSEYQTLANQIQNLLTGCDGYKNDVNIYLLMQKIKNNADYLKLVKAFGVRKMKGCMLTDDYEAELPTVLKKEVSEYILKGINTYWSGNPKIKYTV